MGLLEDALREEIVEEMEEQEQQEGQEEQEESTKLSIDDIGDLEELEGFENDSDEVTEFEESLTEEPEEEKEVQEQEETSDGISDEEKGMLGDLIPGVFNEEEQEKEQEQQEEEDRESMATQADSLMEQMRQREQEEQIEENKEQETEETDKEEETNKEEEREDEMDMENNMEQVMETVEVVETVEIVNESLTVTEDQETIVVSVGLDTSEDIQVSKPFEIMDSLENIRCDIDNEKVASIDIEETELNKFIKSVVGFHIFTLEDRKILCSDKKVNQSVLTEVVDSAQKELLAGKKFVWDCTEDYRVNGRDFKRFRISYGDLCYLVAYFKKCNAELRAFKKNNQIEKYVLVIG